MTPTAGYPLALQMQGTLAPGTYLTGVLVVWQRGEHSLEPQKITYRFAPLGYGRFFGITADNTKLQMFVETNTPVSNGFLGEDASPLDLSGKPLPEILEAATANGLGQFCAALPPGKELILFQLESSDNSPVWHVTANGWDDKGMVAQLRMNIDASSGSVLSQNFRQSNAGK